MDDCLLCLYLLFQGKNIGLLGCILLSVVAVVKFFLFEQLVSVDEVLLLLFDVLLPPLKLQCEVLNLMRL